MILLVWLLEVILLEIMFISCLRRGLKLFSVVIGEL
jgi:hypothetical protein